MNAVNGARVTGETKVRTVKVRFTDEPFTDARGWKFKLVDLEAEVDVWRPDDYEITIVAVHAQRILNNGHPGQILRLVGSFYDPVFAAGRLAIVEYLRERKEIE
jgi:hypothetical protein